MLETMYVRCAHCGYDNSPEYRFCGMCGASLAHPPLAPKATVPPEKPVPANGVETTTEHIETVHGPSFLGLSEDARTEFHYLYEDEQPKSHLGLVFFVLVLMAGAGFLAWQWRNNGYPFNHLSAAGSAPPSASASPSEVPPTQTPDQQSPIDKPATGVADQPSRPPAATKPLESTDKSNEQAAAEHTTPPKSETKDADSEDEQAASPESSEGKALKEEARATPPSIPQKPLRPKPQPRTSNPKPATPVAAAGLPGAAPDSDLELVGERYLYGNGLPQNCSRAESSLRTAALHGNSKAQTVLGTMYATGHCVGRDLPTAYRWFARALHQEPQNSRISADLQVLWRQMSPQERQLATGSQ